MSTIAPEFRLSRFIASLVDIIFWILLIFTIVGLPIVFIMLFYIKLPVINGQLLTPYLALSCLADPSRTIPIIKSFIHSTFFRVAVFPGFGFASLLSSATIFVERKFLAMMILSLGQLYCENIEVI